MMTVVLTCLVIYFLHMVCTDSGSVSWCYHSPACSDVTWPIIAEKYCNGSRQSPINILTANVKANANLTSFTYIGYNDSTALTAIRNTGTAIQVALDQKKMGVVGGGLQGMFASTEFHLHWGNGSNTPGSEHAVNGKRFPMELHIVNKPVRNTSDSLAVFGVFIEASNETGKPESWKTLISYLPRVVNAGDEANLFRSVSMDDLLSGMDRTKYYRYLGSLTTPNCKEGVIWTIFKDPIRVSQDLIDLFSTTVYINKSSSSPLMTNTFRSVQPVNGRIVMSQVAGTKTTGLLKPTSIAANPCQSLMCPVLCLILLYCILGFL